MLSLLLCLGAVILPAAARAAGSISGTVTDAATEAPIEGLQVCAYPVPEDGNVAHCGTTGSTGEYTISLTIPHGYRVTFEGEPLGYRPQWYDHKDYAFMADIVPVGSDPITGIDAAMGRHGRIDGVVTEAESEDPVAGVRVCAWARPTNSLGGCAWTDASGAYTISDVRPGEYIIEFLPHGNQLPQVYDQKERFSEATLVPVGLGEIVTGIDAELPPAAQVEGVVLRADNEQPLLGLMVCAWGIGDEAFRCAYPESDGSYSISGLPTAEYLIEFKPFDSKWQTQFWDHKANWDEADPLLLSAGTTASGIDAEIALELLQSPQLSLSNPLAMSPLQASPPSPKPRACQKGFHRKRIGTKVRCVRKHRRHHHR